MFEYVCIVTSERGDPEHKFIVSLDLFSTYEEACEYGKLVREREMPYKADWFVYRGFEWR